MSRSWSFVRSHPRAASRSGIGCAPASPVQLAAAVLALAGVLAGAPARAEDPQAESKELASHAGTGAAAALGSLVYAPVKVVYAAGGGVVAGLAYVLSGGDAEVAKPILDASVRGDYVLTPEHVTGERGVEFVGRPAEDAPARTSKSPAAEPPPVGASWE